MKARNTLVLMGRGLLAVLVLVGGRAHAAPPVRSIDPGDDPPGVNCLGNTTADFYASADTIQWGEGVTVTWSVRVPSGCAAVTQSITSRGSVARSGSFTVVPPGSVSYVLTVFMAGASRTLGTVSVAMQLPQPNLAPPRENLDANLPRDPTRELTMTAGRLNKVPVSGVWYGQFTLSTAGAPADNRVEVRVRCVSALAPSDQCDPGLLVVPTSGGGQVLNLAYNNDHPAGGANGLGSYVSLTQGPGQAVTYQVVVYSHHRGTSRVNVQWAATAGSGATDWSVPNVFQDPLNPSLAVANLNQVVGGVLVALGPVNGADHLNVRTVDDGATAGTRMWLFNPTRRAFAFVDGPTSGDRDPDYLFSAAWTCDAACAAGRLTSETFAIVGKDDLASGPEVWVDLVKSISAGETVMTFPFGSCDGRFERPSCLSNVDTTLPPGVYYFSVFATTSKAVGAVPGVDGGDHPGKETGNELCSNGDVSIPRGQGNDLALTLELVEDGQPVRTRQVPRGALGAELLTGVEWNRLTVEHTVPDDGVLHRYRINLRNVGPGVIVDSRWSHRRNPEDVELKVATLNVEYSVEDTVPGQPQVPMPMQLPVEMQNVADLLGRGPDYNGPEVLYRANRGQWRWEADILNFNEILPDRGSWMQDRLNARTGLQWLRSEGLSVQGTSLIGTDRNGPVLLGPFAQKGGQDASFGAVLDQTRRYPFECSSGSNGCGLADVFRGFYRTVPARAAVRRMKGSTGGFLEKPITVFHTYLPSADDQIADRDLASTRLVEHMEDLLALQPGAFNSSVNPDPRDLGNRMIVLGDFNMNNNQCSEVNGMLRKLREAFGYAIDVSMAAVDRDNRTFDMHYSGGQLTDFRTGTYGNCQDGNWVAMWPFGESSGCSFRYPPASNWEVLGRQHTTGPLQQYQWWAGTTSEQGGGGSRLDVVLLVGLGWADDDPVREYLAMANTEVPNIANGFQPAGVEIRHYCHEPQVLLGNAGDYYPENPICVDVAQPGAIAFRSDHKPVGTRLRVQFYR